MVPIEQVFGKTKPPPQTEDSSASDNVSLSVAGGGSLGPYYPSKFLGSKPNTSFADVVAKSSHFPGNGLDNPKDKDKIEDKAKQAMYVNGLTLVQSKKHNKWNKNPMFSSG